MCWSQGYLNRTWTCWNGSRRRPPRGAPSSRRTIDARIDDIVDSVDRSRALRRAALSYHGSWRDVVLLLCVLLFTVIWWDVNHSRSNWLPMFILSIVLSVVTAAYTVRGMVRIASSYLHRLHAEDRQDRLPSADAEK